MNSNQNSSLSRLAVCSWSLRPKNPDDLIQQLTQIGIPRMQCALDPLRESPQVWGNLPALCAEKGVAIVSGMFGTAGEDYSTLESIKRTGGLVPDDAWAANWQHIQKVAQIAQTMGLKLITFHAGFLPHEPNDPNYLKLQERIRQVAGLFANQGIELAFETGQEDARALRAFLENLGCKNIGVNFDPANMILYDKGDPIEAMKTLGPWIRQCHLKDANRTKVPGTWGEEVVLGAGQVRWDDFFATLRQLQFTGYCCIEREAGEQRITDIKTARQVAQRFGMA